MPPADEKNENLFDHPLFATSAIPTPLNLPTPPSTTLVICRVRRGRRSFGTPRWDFQRKVTGSRIGQLDHLFVVAREQNDLRRIHL